MSTANTSQRYPSELVSGRDSGCRGSGDASNSTSRRLGQWVVRDNCKSRKWRMVGMRLTATDWPPALQSHEISNTFVDHVFIITCFIFAHYPGNRSALGLAPTQDFCLPPTCKILYNTFLLELALWRIYLAPVLYTRRQVYRLTKMLTSISGRVLLHTAMAFW